LESAHDMLSEDVANTYKDACGCLCRVHAEFDGASARIPLHERSRDEPIDLCTYVEAAHQGSAGGGAATLRQPAFARVPPPPPPTAFRCLFLVHTNAILEASFAKFLQHFGWWLKPGALQKIEHGTDPSVLSRASFIFCLLQSFDKLPEHIVETTTHVIFDEVHHALADTWGNCLTTLQRQPALVYLLGITATLSHREDPFGVALKAVFRDTVYAEFPWMLAKHHGFFPRVAYIECIPAARQSNQDREGSVDSYAALLEEFRQHGILSRFLQRLDTSLRVRNPKFHSAL
jgi:hypothetical protein